MAGTDEGRGTRRRCCNKIACSSYLQLLHLPGIWRRMFALAVSRARRRVILAAVANDDEAASVFLGLLPPDAPALDPTAVPLSLRAQVGRLRRSLVFNPRAADAASSLAAELDEPRSLLR